MKHSKGLIKGLTISGFVILISGFVAYRAGLFDKTKPEKKDTDEVMMPSTKSMPLIDEQLHPSPEPGKDLADKNKKGPKEKDTFRLRNDQVMSGSKSMIVLPQQRKSEKVVVPKVQQVKVDSFFLDEDEIMGSSKSGRIQVRRMDTVSQRQE